MTSNTRITASVLAPWRWGHFKVFRLGNRRSKVGKYYLRVKKQKREI